MPLTVRQNGSVVGGQPNTVMASWFNDYHDLLTGAMLDQGVRLRGGLTVMGTTDNPSTAPTLALAAGNALGTGVYQYVVTFVLPSTAETPETGASPSATATTTSGNQVITINSIPIGGAPVVARRIYRTTAGGSALKALVTINDNTTTTYTDSIPDSSLGTAAPLVYDGAGGLNFRDAEGVWHGAIYPTGQLALDSGALWSDGTGVLTGTSFLVTGGLAVPYFGPGSYSTARRIFVQPATPTGTVAKGDVWIKTPF